MDDCSTCQSLYRELYDTPDPVRAMSWEAHVRMSHEDTEVVQRLLTMLSAAFAVMELPEGAIWLVA